MKIALLGGSFNPVHKGHLALAESAVKLAGYDRVVFVPAYQSPFKHRSSDASSCEAQLPHAQTAVTHAPVPYFSDEERVDMLRLAISTYPWAELELCEIERGGVSYTIDTVRFLTEKYASEGIILKNGERAFLDGKLGLIIGADLVEGFPRWKEADALSCESDIILARRPDSAEAELVYPHISIMNEMHDVSSTEVRRRIACQEELSALIPDEICRYIKQRGAYVS